MNSTTPTYRVGGWASLIAAFSLIAFTVCFALIAMTQELAMWTTLEAHLEGLAENDQTYKHIAQFSAWLFGFAFLVVLHVLYEIAPAEKKLYARISCSFGMLFAGLIGINYFLQLNSVRFAIEAGKTAELSDWIMFNPVAPILGIAMLGWTWMLGLSSLFMALALPHLGRLRAIRVLFFLNALFCTLGGIGFFLQNFMLVNLSMNMGMGGIVTSLMIVLTLYFFNGTASE